MQELAVSTVIFDGYDFSTAFSTLERQDIGFVEIAYIDGYVTFKEEDLTASTGKNLKELLTKYHLKCRTFGAHIDFGTADAPERMKRRFEVAAAAGAQMVITNACFVGDEEQFYDNIIKAEKLAAQYDLLIGLENTGFARKTVCTDARELADVVKKLNLPHVKANYDTANVVTYSWGAKQPTEGIEALGDTLWSLHLKDTKKTPEGCYQMCPVGTGEVNNKAVLQALKGGNFITTLEMPLRIFWNQEHNSCKHANPLQLTDIEKHIADAAAWFYQTTGDL